MIPVLYKLGQKDKEYKYGFRWAVKFDAYILKVRTFSCAFQFWKQEVKKWMMKKLRFMN